MSAVIDILDTVKLLQPKARPLTLSYDILAKKLRVMSSQEIKPETRTAIQLQVGTEVSVEYSVDQT